MQMIYGVKDRPKAGQLILFALQQLLAILAATIAVPMIIGNGMSPSAALLGAGIGTIVYLLFTKFKSPVFLGSSFAFLGSMSAAFAGAATTSLGYLGLIIGAVMAGLVYVIIAVIVKFAGTKWIDKIMPAVVIGPTVAIIGLSLAGNAIGDLMKGSAYYGVETAVPVIKDGVAVIETVTESVMYCSPYVAMLCGLTTLAVTIVCSVYGKKLMKMIPFIIGILSGYSLAAIFTGFSYIEGAEVLRVIDFTKFNNMQWYPDLAFVSAIGDLGDPSAIGPYIGKIAVAYIPVAFVVFAEHLADHKNISSIIETDLLKEPGLHRTLLGDGLATTLASLFGAPENTTYGENTGVLSLTKVYDPAVIRLAAGFAILFSFSPKFAAIIGCMPTATCGGVSLVLYGMISAVGVRNIVETQTDFTKSRNVIIAALILVLSIGIKFYNADGAIVFQIANATIKLSGLAVGALTGILLNAILPGKDYKFDEEKPDDTGVNFGTGR